MEKKISFLKDNALLLLIMIVAVFLRFYHLDFQSPWLDEVLTLKETDPQMPFSEFKDQVLLREGMAHFYFFIIRILNELFTYSSYTARFFSAIIGVLCVYNIYILGRNLFNKNVGLLSSLFLTINWFAILYSQEARSYNLLLLFTIISYSRLIYFIKKSNFKNALLLGVFNGLIIHSHMIGLITIFSQYLLLLLFFILSKDSKAKINLFKNGALTFLTTLIVAIPTYKMFLKVLKYKSGWMSLPDKDALTNIFHEFLGNSEILYFFFTSIIIYYLVKLFSNKMIKSDVEDIIDNKIIFSGIFFFFWITVPITFAIIKTYVSEPMILNRYFITLIPPILIMIAIGMELIKNNIIKNIIIYSIIIFSIVDLFIVKDYYNKVTKTQFREVSNYIKEKNYNNDKVVSTYGWIISYFFENKENSETTIEFNFNDYINSLKSNSSKKESFWYMDGNFQPYNLTSENELYLSQNYTLVNSVDLVDAWAKHYRLKQTTKNNLNEFNISSFKGGNKNELGNVLLFENTDLISDKVYLSKGKYNLILNGNSLPDKPINNESAHLMIYMNGNNIYSLYLDENKAKSEKSIPIEIENDKECVFIIKFDNDYSKDGSDRNAIINSISLKKINSD